MKRSWRRARRENPRRRSPTNCVCVVSVTSREVCLSIPRVDADVEIPSPCPENSLNDWYLGLPAEVTGIVSIL